MVAGLPCLTAYFITVHNYRTRRRFGYKTTHYWGGNVSHGIILVLSVVNYHFLIYIQQVTGSLQLARTILSVLRLSVTHRVLYKLIIEEVSHVSLSFICTSPPPHFQPSRRFAGESEADTT